MLDMPVDYESLAKLGSIMGSGGMIVMDETSCMVDVARYFMEFCMSESCGKCVPCRVGTVQMHRLLEKITRREATPRESGAARGTVRHGEDTSLCGLGQTAPNPVLSTLRYFRDEYNGARRGTPVPGGRLPTRNDEESGDDNKPRVARQHPDRSTAETSARGETKRSSKWRGKTASTSRRCAIWRA